MLDRQVIKTHRASLQNTLDLWAEDNGFSCRLGVIRFSSIDFKVSLQVNAGSSGSYERDDFCKWCFKFDLEPEDYKIVFGFLSKEYTLVGFRPKASKYPFIAENENGTRYRLPKDAAYYIRRDKMEQKDLRAQALLAEEIKTKEDVYGTKRVRKART